MLGELIMNRFIPLKSCKACSLPSLCGVCLTRLLSSVHTRQQLLPIRNGLLVCTLAVEL
jgi:hypothetical protein